MERPSQILAMRAPNGDWTGLAHRLEQPFGEGAVAANTNDRFVGGNYSDLKCSDTPIIILGHGSAGNDAAGEDSAISEDDAEPWARHAFAANGFGDVAITDTPPVARPTSYEMYHAARSHRSFAVGEIIIAAIQAVGAIARRAYARLVQRRQARDIHNALHQLNDSTLRDLGFDRSEISSLAVEVTGEAECTRVRARQTWHALPK
jgi:uncharacterized protein YjiS (DUF1127 family)